MEEWPYAIRLGDLNGDKKIDIAVSLSGENQSALPVFYLNRGDGTFAPLPATRFTGSPYPMLDLIDANRDGRLDVVSAAYGGQGSSDVYAISLQAAPVAPKHLAKKPTKKKCVHRSHHACR